MRSAQRITRYCHQRAGQQWGLYVTAGGYKHRTGTLSPTGHPRGYTSRGAKVDPLGYQALYIAVGSGVQSQFSGRKRSPRQRASAVRALASVSPLPKWLGEYGSVSTGPMPTICADSSSRPQTPVLKTGGTNPSDAYVRVGPAPSEPVGFQQLLAATAMEILAAMGGSRQRTAASMHKLSARPESMLEMQPMQFPPSTIGKLEQTRPFLSAPRAYGLSPYQYHSLRWSGQHNCASPHDEHQGGGRPLWRFEAVSFLHAFKQRRAYRPANGARSLAAEQKRNVG